VWVLRQQAHDLGVEKAEPKCVAQVDFMLHLANHNGASWVSPEKPSFQQRDCTSSTIPSQKEVMCLLYPHHWLKFAIVIETSVFLK
jgi:hypothetical protein